MRYCCSLHGRNEEENDPNDPSSDQSTGGPVMQSYSSVSAYVQPIEGRGLISSSNSQSGDRHHRIGNATTTFDPHDDRQDVCCHPHDPNAPSLYNFIRRNINKWHNLYGLVMDIDEDGRNAEVDFLSSKVKTKKIVSSPLRQAVSFHSSAGADLPCTINADEIVLPGSVIQHQMAQQMILSANVQTNVEECVICMEPFDASNPRMPTLCSCGVNKTYFHLPCLYQWIEQSMECPSCRTKITWEEF
jgi:Ring finger domain